jgi:hypothetical protein
MTQENGVQVWWSPFPTKRINVDIIQVNDMQIWWTIFPTK